MKKNFLANALRASTELIIPPIIAVFIGIYIDKKLNSWPFITILLFFLGAAAGILNIYRMFK